MLLPIGDEPNPREATPVNWLLIGANVAIFALISLPLTLSPAADSPATDEYLRIISRETGVSVAQILQQLSAYDLFVFEHGFRPAHPQIADLFFSMFLHAGIAHLLGNMLFLWIYGDNVENRLGSTGYLFAYLGTGVAASLAHSLIPGSGGQLPMVGASGAISGVLGFYFIWFPQNRVRLLFWFYFWVEVILIPARWVLGFYLIVENLLPFMLAPSGDGVARGAHLGGFVAGALLAVFLDHRRHDRSISHWLPDSQSFVPPSARPRSRVELDEVVDAIQAGQMPRAVRVFLELPPRDQAAVPAPRVWTIAEWLVQQSRPDVALAVLRQALSARSPDAGAASLHLFTGLIYLHEMRSPAEAYRHLIAVGKLDPEAEVKRRAEAALAEIHAKIGAGERPIRFIG